MKQYKAILCITMSALLLSSCSSEKTEKHENAETEISSVSTSVISSVQETEKITMPVTKPVTQAVTDSKLKYTSDPYYPVIPVNQDDLPVMCSTISSMDLETQIKIKLFDSYYEAQRIRSYFNSPANFTHLLSGDVDLIIGSPVSGSQQQEADDAGVQLDTVPVAKEALVFFVSNDNPVNSLTQEQIRDIYSGKITNWAELGGNDEEIIPYQRKYGTKSQDHMLEFMNGCDIIRPVRNSLVPAQHSSLFTSIDVYTNESNAIGYSAYSYAVQICENSDSIKAIAIDGITPSKETISDGTYPLINSICVIHRDEQSEKTTKFINWLLSESGQECVFESGYFPVNNIELPNSFKLYETKGTGKIMPEDYTPSRKISVISGEKTDDLSWIRNEDLRKMIKEDLNKCVSAFSSEGYEERKGYFYGENGYITFYKDFAYLKNNQRIFTTRSFTYDLIENKRITKYSDLFFKDSDFVPLLNRSVSYIMSNAEFGSYIPDNDFIGITDETDAFSVKGITFSENYPYYKSYRDDIPWFTFSDCDGPYATYRTAYDLLPLAMVTGVYYDFNDLVMLSDTDDIAITEEVRHEWYSHSILEESARSYYISYDTVNGSLFHTEEEIRQRNIVVNKVITHVRDKYESIHPLDNDPQNAPMTADNICKYNYHADNIYNVMPYCTSESSEYYTETDYYLTLFAGFEDGNDHYNNLFYRHSFFDRHYAGYDPETGEPLTFADVFGPEFSDIDENYAMFTYSVSSEPDGSNFVRFVYGKPFENDEETETIEIPIVREHLNMKYFIPADEVMISANKITDKMIGY